MSTIFLEKLNTHSVFEQLLWKLCCKQCVIWIVWKNIGSFFLYRFHFTFIITGRHFFTQECQGFMPKYYIRENALCFFTHKRKSFKISPSWNSCCILNRDFTIEEKCVGDSIWLSLWRKPYKTKISHSIILFTRVLALVSLLYALFQLHRSTRVHSRVKNLRNGGTWNFVDGGKNNLDPPRSNKILSTHSKNSI